MITRLHAELHVLQEGNLAFEVIGQVIFELLFPVIRHGRAPSDREIGAILRGLKRRKSRRYCLGTVSNSRTARDHRIQRRIGQAVQIKPGGQVVGPQARWRDVRINGAIGVVYSGTLLRGLVGRTGVAVEEVEFDVFMLIMTANLRRP